MCWHCLADSDLVYEEIIPGHNLYRANKSEEDSIWKIGYIAVTQGAGDPLFLLTKLPSFSDPLEGLSDDQINELDDNSEVWLRYREFESYVLTFAQDFRLPVLEGYEFVKSCKESGYDEEVDGYNIEYWFINRIAKKLGF